MFGSTNPFGQSSSSPFASQPGFGQTSSTNNNPFAPKPFGSTTPFGSQTGGSLFGGTSTGVFGAAQSSSPFSSTTTFGATSTPAFGSSTPAFGSSSTPTFGSSSSSFGGSLVFGQKPAFGGFGSTPTQSSPFGSTTQQSQPAFGTSIFGQTSPFGSSQPAFSGTTAPAFGGVTTPAFGTGSTPAFGSSTTSAFGSTSAPGFAFGSSSAFGSSATSAFGTQSASPFGAQTASAFAPSSTPSFSFGTTSAFGQTTSAFGSSPFGSTAFAAQSSPFGAQSSASPFGSPSVGQSPFGGQRGGSRVAPYTPTTDTDGGSTTQPPGKLESISAMPIYKDKSHEELRWEDYQSGDKGGPQPAAPSSGGITFGAPTAQSSPFASSSAFAHTSANPFSATTPSNPFMSKPPGISNTGFATSTTPSNPFASGPSNPFAAPQSNPFGSTSTTVTSIFNSAPSPSSSLFNTSTTAPFASSSSLFSSGPAPSTFNTGLGFSSSQTSSLFSTTTPNPQTSPGFGQSTSSFAQVTAPAFSQSNMFSTSLFQGSLSLAPSSSSGAFIQSAPSFGTPFQQPQPSQTFSISSFGLPQQGGTSSLIGQGNFGSLSATQGAPVMQPLAVTNPFGNLPAMPQISIGRAGAAPSVQYGISSMPVIEKPAPVRISPLLTSRHLSHRRIRLPARKYWPNTDSPKVPFFTDDEETPSTPKADAVFIPRENPRSLVIHPMEHWPSRTSAERTSSLKETSTPSHVNGTSKENGVNKEKVNASQKPNGVEDEHPVQEDSYRTLSGHRAGEAAIVYEHGADIEALMPKLRRSDYYTEPRIQELAAKERAEPGYCRHVKDFVVGRHGYGSIKFLGETDVRGLDLESLVQFNNREVIVYVDDTKKPPVGQGLNKPAEVTLLNIKCFDKKTGRQYTEGPKVEKYKEMLKRKVEDQEAEFVSFDPIKGEWKFRVRHFSAYRLLDDGDVEGEGGNDDKDEEVSEIGA